MYRSLSPAPPLGGRVALATAAGEVAILSELRSNVGRAVHPDVDALRVAAFPAGTCSIFSHGAVPHLSPMTTTDFFHFASPESQFQIQNRRYCTSDSVHTSPQFYRMNPSACPSFRGSAARMITTDLPVQLRLLVAAGTGIYKRTSPLASSPFTCERFHNNWRTTEESTMPMQLTFAKRISECPDCGGNSVRRSMRKGFVERVWFRLALVWPYRCDDCDSRFWGFRRSCESARSSFSLRSARSVLLGGLFGARRNLS